jgi:predicted DNA-binding transcriptional regulator AlpA
MRKKNPPPLGKSGGELTNEERNMNKVRNIVDHLLGRRVPKAKLNWIGQVLNDPEWTEPSLEPLLLNMAEAAHKLGCSRSYFWGLRKKGAVPTVIFNGTRYVRTRDLDALVDNLKPQGGLR